MLGREKKWFIKNKVADFKVISKCYGISEIIARLIVNRDIKSNEELETYLYPTLEHMHNPLLMKDMDKACDLLVQKIQEKRKIRIVGDYDVDGVMATYILHEGLKRCGANIDLEIPERIKDGYGINISIIEAAYEEGVDTIITCDNGISALEQIKRAKELGMTVIITDHHDIPFIQEENQRVYVVPEADAVVNPKQADQAYPYDSICGAVVALKLIQVMYNKYKIEEEESNKFLEFAAIATVCDVMDLKNENRVIVKNGLERLQNTRNVGLRALMEETQITDKKIGVYHLGFIIGPCINASGRLESAKLGLSLFMEKDPSEAKKMANQLRELNDERKNMTNNGLAEAVDKLESTNLAQDKVIVVYLPECHESIAGIIAGRIKERYHKPAIVLTKSSHGVKGSARSIEEYNMFEELNRCKELLTKFGGHPMAAGLSLGEESIDELRQTLNRNTVLTEDDLMEKVSFDMILSLNQINYNLIHEISLLEPYGKGNAKPLFVLRHVKVMKAIVLGKNRNVLRLTIVEENNTNRYTAMIFNDIELFEQTVVEKYGKDQLEAIYSGRQSKVTLDIVFYPEINEYNGIQNIQIMVQHYR